MEDKNQCPRHVQKETPSTAEPDATSESTVPSKQTKKIADVESSLKAEISQRTQSKALVQGSRVLIGLKRRMRGFLGSPNENSELHKSLQNLTLNNARALRRKSSSTENNIDSPFAETGGYITRGVSEDTESYRLVYDAALLRLSSLTEAQVNGVQGSWMLLKNHIEKIGVIVFLGLFEEHSDFRDAFARFRRKQLSKLTRDPAFQAHGLRVLNVVDKIISRLPKIASIQEFLLGLGSKHCRYIPNMNLIPAVGEQILEAVRPVLQEQGIWDADTEIGWEAVVAYLHSAMRYGLARAPRNP